MQKLIIKVILLFMAFALSAQSSGPDLNPATSLPLPSVGSIEEPTSMVNENLKISLSDTRLLRNKDGSWELFIKKTLEVESILITDSTVDPEAYSDNYSLRAYESDPSFAKEKRILNNKVIDNKVRIEEGLDPLYFIMDSQAETYKELDRGENLWFHVHMPASVMYGYPWSREGQFDIAEDTWIGIRTFGEKWADYKKGFKDNPFKIGRLSPIIEPTTPREVPFTTLAKETRGLFAKAQKNSEIKAGLEKIFTIDNSDKIIDIAIVLDTTISMKYTVAYLKENLVNYLINNVLSKYPDKKYRVALVKYRDYKPDQYLTEETDFADNLDVLQQELDTIIVNGGRDIPEAVYEGIDSAMEKLSWSSSSKKIIIQLGDAIPHPKPRGNVSQDSVINKANERGIKIYPILLNERLKDVND